MNALPATLSPDPTDSEDVVSALETADVFWTKGDADEAMRWLKRAAESSSDAGNDARALVIARGVADLKSISTQVVEAPSIAPQQNRPPPPSSAARQAPPPPSAVRSGAQENSEVRRAPPLPTGATSPSEVSPPSRAAGSQKAPPPLPTSKAKESSAAPSPPLRHSSIPPAPPAAPRRSPSTERVAAIAPEHGRSIAPSSKFPPAVAAEPARAASVPSQARIAAATATPVANASGANPAGTRRIAPAASAPNDSLSAATAYRALNVYVMPQGRDGDNLEVIIAKPGQAPPPGAEPALLVPTRRGARLLI